MHRIAALVVVAGCGRAPLDPDRLTHVATLPEAGGVAVGDGHAFANTEAGVLIVEGAEVIATVPTSPGTGESIVFADGILYVDRGDRFDVIDVTEVRAPVIHPSVWTTGRITGLSRFEDRLFVTDEEVGPIVYDLADPRAPTWFYGLTGGEPTGVVGTARNQLVMGFGSGFDKITLRGDTYDQIGTDGGRVYFLDGAPDGAYVYGVTSNSLRVLHRDPFRATAELAEDEPLCVRVAGDRVLVGTDRGRVTFWDRADPAVPARIGHLAVGGAIHDLAVDDAYLYVAAASGLEVYARDD